MSSHPLTNFEIQKFNQNKPKFNGVYSRNNLPKIKGGTYVINLDEYKSIGTHWIALHVNYNNVTYFVSFGVGHISKAVKKLVDSKNMTTNICRIQTNHSIMCKYFCIGFIDFILKSKSLICYTNLFSLNKYGNNDITIL